MDKFKKILDVIDHQEKYSDEEVREILQDEECRKLYQTMVEVDSALIQQSAEEESSTSHISTVVDEEWKKFENKHFANHPAERGWRKIAAAIAGFVLVSGIAYAAIHSYIKRSQEAMMIAHADHTEVVVNDSAKQEALAKDSLVNVKKVAKPAIHKTFENVSFDKIIAEIASYYDMQVRFDNADAKNLRLYYEWDSHSSIESIVKELNQFENVNIGLEDHTIVIK